MNELLAKMAENSALVAMLSTALVALIGLIIAAMDCARSWLKAKFPTVAESVESNWTYLKPHVLAAINTARAASANGTLTGAVVSNIIAAELSGFVSDYALLERKDASATEVAAAREELVAALAHATGGK